jgi:hypothetical protein
MKLVKFTAIVFSILTLIVRTASLFATNITWDLIATSVQVVYFSVFTIFDGVKSLYLLFIIYVETIQSAKKEHKAKNQIKKTYQKLNAFFMIHFAFILAGVGFWIAGAVMKIEDHYKVAELIAGLVICGYPILIISFRELRFEQRM